MNKTHKVTHFSKIPKTYVGLVSHFMPRPIHDKVSFENATEVLDMLAGHELNEDQNDYFEALSLFVEEYETQHNDLIHLKLRGLKALQFLMKENNLTAADLSRLLDADRTVGSKLLNGSRSLSIQHIRTLAEHFKVSADLFLE